MNQIFEIVMTVLFLVIGVLLVIVTNGMSQSQRNLKEMEVEIERRQIEEKIKSQNL